MRTHAKAIAGLSALLLTLVLGVSLANAVGPVATIDSASPSEVRYTTAKVTGTVDPGDEFTWYFFETSTDEGATWSGFDFQFGLDPGLGAEPVSQELTGLQPNTDYKVRLVANDFVEPEAISSEESFKTQAVAKPSVSEVTVSAVGGASASFSATVNPNAPESEPVSDPAVEAAFESSWHFECEPSCGELGGANVPAGDEAKEVKADATDLKPNTDYKVKLVSTNAGGSSESGQKAFKTSALAPTVSDPVHTQLGLADSGEVAIGGFVNTRKSALTDCHFEYGKTDSYGTTVPCETPLPNSDEAALVRAELTGLTPGETYHFRYSVDNGVDTAVSDDSSFIAREASAEPSCSNATALGAEELSDCRAWELASPMGKLGGDVMNESTRNRAAIDGSAVNFGSMRAFGDSPGTNISVDYIARRSTDPDPGHQGWTTHSITPPQDPLALAGTSQAHDARWEQLSSDLTTGVFRSWSPLTDAPAVERLPNVYVRRDLLEPGSGSYELFSDCPALICPAPLKHVVQLARVTRSAGASASFERVIFESRYRLSGDAPQPNSTSEAKLYASYGGDPLYVGMIPSAPQSTCGGGGPACEPAVRSLAGRGVTAAGFLYTNRTITEDGSRVFFTVRTGEFPDSGALYMRDDQGTTDPSDDTTTAIAGVEGASEHSSPEEAKEARFESASTGVDEQGNRVPARVFFTTNEKLVDEDDDTGTGTDLYMWDEGEPEGDRLTLVSVDRESEDGELSVRGLAGPWSSNDGAYVYFTSQGQLVEGKPLLGTAFGLYAWHEGEITYISRLESAGLASADVAENTFGDAALRPGARVTPDGGHLLFAAITGEGLLSAHGGADVKQKGVQLYHYDAEADELSCASCRPGAGATLGEALTKGVKEAGAAAATSYVTRSLSDDGRYVFFSTKATLLPRDVNGRVDAYRYDSHSGEVSLLSSGRSTSDSFFMDASADGSDVFFNTREQLSGWDVDDNLDLYDARIDGGFPEPPPPPPGCVGDACQPAAPNLSDPTLSSSSFSGAGNPKPSRKVLKPCPAGKRKARTRRGKTRCVRKRGARRTSQRNRNSNRRAGR